MACRRSAVRSRLAPPILPIALRLKGMPSARARQRLERALGRTALLGGESPEKLLQAKIGGAQASRQLSTRGNIHGGTRSLHWSDGEHHGSQACNYCRRRSGAGGRARNQAGNCSASRAGHSGRVEPCGFIATHSQCRGTVEDCGFRVCGAPADAGENPVWWAHRSSSPPSSPPSPFPRLVHAERL
jgi:hypothetical protein